MLAEREWTVRPALGLDGLLYTLGFDHELRTCASLDGVGAPQALRLVCWGDPYLCERIILSICSNCAVSSSSSASLKTEAILAFAERQVLAEAVDEPGF